MLVGELEEQVGVHYKYTSPTLSFLSVYGMWDETAKLLAVCL